MGAGSSDAIGADGRLVLSAPTLVPHRDRMSAAEVRELADAAADAGFTDLSIWSAHLDWAVDDGMTAEEYFDYHQERGLGIPAVEFISDWHTSDLREVTAATVHQLDVAARAGASSIIAVTLEEELPPLAEAVVGLRHACDLAAERGLRVSFEFLPWTAVPTLTSALRLFDAVGRDNIGLVFDTWHWFRQPGGPDLDALRSTPPDRVHLLQLDDAPAAPAEDLLAETGSARLLPGEGAIDILGVLDVLADIGATPVVVAEVFSAALAKLGAAESARRQHAAVRTVLEQHRNNRAGRTDGR